MKVKLLSYHLKTRQHQNSDATPRFDTLMPMFNRINQKFVINESAALEKFPIEGTLHRTPFLADYFTDKIAKEAYSRPKFS